MKKISLAILLAMAMLLTLLPTAAMALEEVPEVVLPDGVTESNFGNNVVLFNNTYYSSIQSALAAANNVGEQETAVLYCKPGAAIETTSHMHVGRSMTIYGNGAVLKGGEQDFELDTFGSELTSDVTLTVYNLTGASAWGQRKTTYTLNINLVDCKNVGKVYLSGTSGDNNITIQNCTFDLEKMTHPSCAVYSNAPGEIVVEDCVFNGVPEPINLNNKADPGEMQDITISNTKFNSCSTTKICKDDTTWAAPIRIVSSNGAVSKVNVENCTFSLKEGEETCNGDILLGDGRANEKSYQTISLSTSGTAAQIQIHKPGDRGTDYSAPSGTLTITENESLNEMTNAVAKVGDELYVDFHEAMLAAESGDTVELLMDVTVNSWQQVWNLSGVKVNGNNHTLKVNAIESLENHDTVFHSIGNNHFYNLTIDLSGISTQSQAQGYKAICAAPGDSFERVKVISGTSVPVYGIFVGGTDAENDAIYIRNCSFTNCSYAIGAEPTSGIASDLETLEVTGCTFTNCNYVGILYAENVTFDNNSVTGGKLNIMHKSQVVTNNIFAGKSRIKFYADPAKFEKNDISAESCLEVVDAVESVDIAMNYWGGGAPSASQLGNAAEKFVGADEYYTSPNMDETNLCTITIIFDNGQMPAEIEGYEVGETFYFQPAPSKAGCIFMGWSWNGRTYQPGDSITITGDMVIRAIWSALPDIEPGQPSQPDEPAVPDFPFTDVSVNAWYYEAVKYVYEKGIMNGMDRYSFQPNGTLTRAMIWTMLARFDGADTEGGNSWYAKAQEWATATGVSDGENPTGEVTREQLITMLWRYAGSPTYTADLSGYVDTADISSWAQQAMCWAVATGVIEGDENSALTPKADTTRAQAAAMLMRAIEL